MNKDNAQPGRSTKEIRVACDLIQTDDDRSAAMEALRGGSATRTYAQLLGREVYDLTSTELIWIAWYRLGLSVGSDQDDDISVELLTKLDKRRRN